MRGAGETVCKKVQHLFVLRLLALLALATASPLAAAQADPPRSVVIDRNASYPEGPLWRDGRLYVAEMGADRVSVYRNGAKADFFVQRGCGPTALAPYGEGFAILCHIARTLVIVDRQGARVRVIAADGAGRAFQDPNDISADDRGGAYFSDPGIFSRRIPASGALYHLDARGRARRVAEGLWYPNGVYFDRAERALYVSETFRHRVLRFAVLEDGALGAPSVFATFDFAAAPFGRYRDVYDERGPDGLERAPDGRLFVAIYGEGVVVALDRDGRIAAALPQPARYTTNIAFAPDGAAIVVGATINDRPPFTGEVRRFPRP
ncbi:MAG: SMP-30/gluconolactonase/LRE family protein [Hyphomonadaceae bacterium]|nr:SMP-30/gluconolactonase/LRE family protein [Hyphomonadaceae bacterium]